MKILVLLTGMTLAMAFTHPFAEQGGVATDHQLLEERIEKAHENRMREKRADKLIREQRQEEKLLPVESKSEERSKMNEAEKLVD